MAFFQAGDHFFEPANVLHFMIAQHPAATHELMIRVAVTPGMVHTLKGADAQTFLDKMAPAKSAAKEEKTKP